MEKGEAEEEDGEQKEKEGEGKRRGKTRRSNQRRRGKQFNQEPACDHLPLYKPRAFHLEKENKNMTLKWLGCLCFPIQYKKTVDINCQVWIKNEYISNLLVQFLLVVFQVPRDTALYRYCNGFHKI